MEGVVEAAEQRRQALVRTARTYVLECLAKGDFDAIPYHPEVELRAPLCPGGSAVPLRGRQALREQWWQPLPELVTGAEVIDIFVNGALTGVAVEFLCFIRQPACTLRIVDRFLINDDGYIIAQENFFDPRDVTHPGWR